MALNGHDPDPGYWHPDDAGAQDTPDGGGHRPAQGAPEHGWDWLQTAHPDHAGVPEGMGTWPDGEGGWWPSPTPLPGREAETEPVGPGHDGAAEGWADLASIELTPPEAPLAGWVAANPGTVTVAYGDGGEGKTTHAAYVAAQVVQGGGLVAILDLEGNAKEWRRKLTYFLGGELPAGSVSIWTPSETPLPGELVALDGVADLLVVDSMSMMQGYPDAVDKWGSIMEQAKALAKAANVPMYLIAHTSKMHPDKPYGSVKAHNLARLTFHVTQDTITCRKANDVAGMWKGRSWRVDFQADEQGTITRYQLGEQQELSDEEQLRHHMAEKKEGGTPPGGGHSVAVLAVATGWSESKVRRTLAAMGAVYEEVPTAAGGAPKRLWFAPS